MEKNKLKMKYLLGIWKDLPEYPTKEDVIYELNSYLIKDGRPDGGLRRFHLCLLRTLPGDLPV